MFHFESEDRSIARSEGMDERALIDAIDAGARIVVFDMVFTLLLNYYVGRRRHLVRPGESTRRIAALPTVITALGGWFGLGILHTPAALYRNLTGGVDVTQFVREELLERLAAKEAKAEIERQVREAASKPGATPEVRRAQVMAFLGRDDVEGAWSLVAEDLIRGQELGQDVDVLRRLVLALRDKRLWERAAKVAAVLRRDHAAEVTGFLATALKDIESHAERPDGYRPPTPFWVQVLCFLAVVAGLVVGGLMLKEKLEGR